MGFSYLNGKSWWEVTRTEQYFCQHLFSLLLQNGATSFVYYLNKKFNLSLPLDTFWEPAFEVCFFRDLHYFRKINSLCDSRCYSPQRTFDLGLFSEEVIVPIEAKAFQRFEDDMDQLRKLNEDMNQIKKETNVKNVYLIGLVSDKYNASEAVKKVFNNRIITWSELSLLFNNDEILAQANSLYDPYRIMNWGKNNKGGYKKGKIILEEFEKGHRYLVGRKGGIQELLLSNDIKSGKWKEHKYETSTESQPPNNNWFSIEEFVMLLKKSQKIHQV